jgi:hypothetical protein
MNLFNNPNQIPASYGFKIAGGLIGYFLLMRVIGQTHHVELRLLNLLILAAGIYYALKKFKATHGKHLNYFLALATGVGVGAIGSMVFAMFLFIWMKLDATLMKSIIDNDPMGLHLNAYMAAFIVALEGVFSGLLVTFVLINYLDTDEVGGGA